MHALAGVTAADLNFGLATLSVHFARGDSGTDLAAVARRHGIGVRRQGSTAPPPSGWWRQPRTAATAAGAALLLLALVLPNFTPLTAMPFLFLAIVIAGAPVAANGLRMLRRGHAGMDLLMMLAALGGAMIGDWSEAATVVVLFGLAHAIEGHTLDRARRAVSDLIAESPRTANVLRNGVEQPTAVADVNPNDIVIVRPGERIPLDGMVVAGTSTVDQSTITGESLPVDKSADDEVFAGTLNQFGALRFRVTRRASETTYAQIIHAIEAAHASRAPVERFVDRFARIYTPTVIAIALIVAFIPPLVLHAPGNHPGRDWFYRGLVFLVAACPCALVISTPVAVITTLATAARHGVLIKGGRCLDALSRAQIVAFDKTGTLTRGIAEVTAVVPVEGSSPERLLRFAAAVESHSEHPLARAIDRYAASVSINLPISNRFVALPGLGASALVEDELFWVGSASLFAQLESPGQREFVDRLMAGGQTVVFVGTSERLEGGIVLADRPRPGTRDVVDRLRHHGIAKTVMLTGDSELPARQVAAACGIDEVRAGLLPQGKVDAIHDLARSEQAVIMVGDGVNDAPALAASSVGIAMGAAGSSIAIEAADVALMSDDLTNLPAVLLLSKLCSRVVKANIALSIATKLLFLVLTFMGWTTLWLAVVFDMGSSLFVTLNSVAIARRSKNLWFDKPDSRLSNDGTDALTNTA